MPRSPISFICSGALPPRPPRDLDRYALPLAYSHLVEIADARGPDPDAVRIESAAGPGEPARHREGEDPEPRDGHAGCPGGPLVLTDRTRRGGERRPNAEGERVEAPRVDAHDSGSIARLADRTQHLSRNRPLHDVNEGEDQGNDKAERN